jgi:hypothetical protein
MNVKTNTLSREERITRLKAIIETFDEDEQKLVFQKIDEILAENKEVETGNN